MRRENFVKKSFVLAICLSVLRMTDVYAEQENEILPGENIQEMEVVQEMTIDGWYNEGNNTYYYQDGIKDVTTSKNSSTSLSLYQSLFPSFFKFSKTSVHA